MDDLKRFRDFRRWESQLADESYVKSVEEENRELQRTAELLPSLFDKRIEEMRRWMDARLREIQGSYNNKFECALARQNVENRCVHDKIVALAARVDTVQQQQIDSKDTTEQLSTELRAAVEEKFQVARQDVEHKLSALSALLEERTDCLKEQEVRTQKHLLQVETDMTQTVQNAEETTQKMICLQDSIKDVSGGMDALKADIATRVQKSIDDVVLHTEALKGNMVELRDNTMLAMSADTQRLQQSVDELALSMGGLKEECKTIIAHDMDVLAKELESKRVQEVEEHAQTRADIRALKNDCANTQVICENFSTNVMSVQNLLQDLTLRMDALKDECHSDLAMESQVREQNILLEAKRLQESITDLTISMGSFKKECEQHFEQHASHAGESINSLTLEVDTLKIGLDALKKECENLAEDSINSLTVEVDVLKVGVDALKKESESERNLAQDSINGLTLELNSLKVGLGALKKECENLAEDSINGLNLELDSLKVGLGALKKECERNLAEDSINNLTLELDALKIELNGLKKECESTLAHESQVRERMSMDAAQLQQSVNDVAQKLDSLQKERESTLQAREENILLALNHTRETINDVALEMSAVKKGVGALKRECENSLATESEKSAAERASICERLLIESDKRAEDGVRIAMRVEEMKKYFAQKEEVWALDMRMVQETMYFKLQKLDEDLTAATFDLGKQVEGVTSSSQEGLASLDEKLASLERKMTTVATTSEETATKVEGVTNSTKDGLASLDEKLASLDKKITTVAITSEEAATKLQEQSAELCLLRRRKEGNMSFSWNITTNDMEKHEVRSPVFALREVENLVLRLYPKGRLTSKPNFSAISLVRKRERTNPFECEEEPLRVTFTTGSVTSKVRELDAWDDEFDAAVAENFVPTVDLCSTIVVTVV